MVLQAIDLLRMFMLFHLDRVNVAGIVMGGLQIRDQLKPFL